MKKTPQTYYDTDADTLFVVYKQEPEKYYEELSPGIIVEFNKKKEVIGLEIQNYSQQVVGSKKLQQFG